MTNLQIHSGLRKGDFRRLAYWNMFMKNKSVLYLLLLLMAIGVAGIFLVRQVFILFVLSIVFAACPVLVLLIMEYNTFKVNRGGDLQKRTSATYIIGEQGISAKSEHEHQPSFYKWGSLYKIYENQRFYMIFIDSVRMLTIAKEDLAPDQELKLRECFSAHMQEGALVLL